MNSGLFWLARASSGFFWGVHLNRLRAATAHAVGGGGGGGGGGLRFEAPAVVSREFSVVHKTFCVCLDASLMVSVVHDRLFWVSWDRKFRPFWILSVG